MITSSDKKPSLLRRLSRTFIAGSLAALPLALTVGIVVWLAEFINHFLGPTSAFGKLLGSIGLRFMASESEVVAYFIGVAATLLLIYLLGVLVEAGIKNRWQSLLDNILNHVPLVRTIYNALNKLTRMFELKDEEGMKSMSAVRCYFGGKENSTVVLALLTTPEPINLNGRDYYAIMIPTAPVPFGGAILYMPVEWVEPANLAFDELLNIYVSMGVTSPDYLHKQPANKVADKKPE